MKQKTLSKILANGIYGIGTAAVLVLCVAWLLGGNLVMNPEAMLPMTLREQAFCWMAGGALPMVLACVAVWQCNEMAQRAHRKRNFLLIFLPGLLCLFCLIGLLGLIGVGMISSCLRWG